MEMGSNAPRGYPIVETSIRPNHGTKIPLETPNDDFEENAFFLDGPVDARLLLARKQ